MTKFCKAVCGRSVSLLEFLTFLSPQNAGFSASMPHTETKSGCREFGWFYSHRQKKSKRLIILTFVVSLTSVQNGCAVLIWFGVACFGYLHFVCFKHCPTHILLVPGQLGFGHYPTLWGSAVHTLSGSSPCLGRGIRLCCLKVWRVAGAYRVVSWWHPEHASTPSAVMMSLFASNYSIQYKAHKMEYFRRVSKRRVGYSFTFCFWRNNISCPLIRKKNIFSRTQLCMWWHGRALHRREQQQPPWARATKKKTDCCSRRNCVLRPSER